MAKPSTPVIALEAIDARIATVLADPAVKTPLKRVLAEFLDRDPVDAVNDAELLVDLLSARADAILAEAGNALRF